MGLCKRLSIIARRSFVATLGAGALIAGLQCAPPVAAFLGSASAEPADRIVSIGGAVTEILYALGQKDRIVAVDATSLYPAEALKEKPNIGYFRALSAESVIAMNPTLVIAIDGAGPPNTFKLLADAGVRLARAPDTPTRDGLLAKIKTVANAAGVSDAAAQLLNDVDRRFAELAAMRAQINAPKRVLFLLALQNGRPLVGGRGTAADAMIELAGGVNAAAAIEGYKQMSDEAILAAAPEAIVMMSQGDGPAANPFDLPAFAATPAGQKKALVVRDGLYLIGFGPRAPEAAHDMMQALYPSMKLPALNVSSTTPAKRDAADQR